MEEVLITTTQNYYLRLTTLKAKITAGPQAVVTIIPPKGYNISGFTIFTLSYGQWITLQLDRNRKTWNIIDGIPVHNNLIGLQGGKPGEYYHLTKAQWQGLTQKGAEIVLTNQSLDKGDNSVYHNLGLKPVVITFWQSDGTPITFPVNINVDPQNNYFNVNCSRPQTNLRIYIRGYGTV